MDMQELERGIKQIKEGIEQREYLLDMQRKNLEQAEAQLADARAAESKKLELVNGDYGKTKTMAGWVYLGGKIRWADGGVSELLRTESFIDSRRGNIFREMEERQE